MTQLKDNILAIVPDLVILNEIAPMGYFLGEKLTLVDIFNVVRESDLTSEIKSKLILERLDQDFSLKYKLLFFFQKIIIKLGFNSKKFGTYIHKIRSKEISSKFLKKFLPIHSIKKFKYLLIRPGNDILIRDIIQDFKNSGFEGMVIGISEAMPTLSNISHDKGIYAHPGEDIYFNKDYSLVHICDKIIINSEVTLNKLKKIGISFEYKVKILKSLRNTHDWQNLIIKKFDKTETKKNKKRILFLHSNFYSNINKYEIKRSLKIANLNRNLEIGFRPHIRMGKVVNDSEIKYLFKGISNYKVFRNSLTEALIWSDLCVFYGSSSAIDALMLNKYTVFLRYGTSNTLDESLTPYVTKCDNPDEFINECSKINNMENIYNSNQTFPLEYASELSEKWFRFFNNKS